MSSLEQLTKVGKELGLKDIDLLNFIKYQQDLERDARREEREASMREAEARKQEAESRKQEAEARKEELEKAIELEKLNQEGSIN